MTFLFTDVEGSTWATEETAMEAALARHDELVRRAIESWNGYMFSTAGDAFAAAFTKASDAIGAAQAVQAAIALEQWPTSSPLRVRVGL